VKDQAEGADPNLRKKLDTTRSVLAYFDAQDNQPEFLKGIHMFVTDDRHLARLGECADFGGGALYTGSFHQFAAYAAWVTKNGFRPLRLYLAAKPS
jgi:hypothetical protein